MAQEEVREQIGIEGIKLLQEFGIDIDYYTPLGRKWGGKLANQILSIPELLIKDPDQSLPKCDVEYNPLACGAEDDTDNCYRGGWDASQGEMLKENWVKVIPKENKW